jgi:hypothetical protein
MRWNDMREAAKTAGVDWPLPASAKETYDQFLTIAKKKNVTQLSEGRQGFGELEKVVERTGQ